MRRTILVVEDNDEFRDVVIELLESSGYSTLSATDGKDALRVIAENKVDLVLSDIRMPVMNGLDLLKHIQALEENRPKVVMMTGFSIYTVEEMIKAGAETLIEKTSFSDQIIKILASIRFG